MESSHIAIALKRFILLDHCPTDWKRLDLYLFRDETVVFYVGQSYLAYGRVWEHLINGFKGHSIVGRFVWCNWPKSMNFTIEMFDSQSEEFREAGNDLNACERLLIQRWSPCFNTSLNDTPTPVPSQYLSANSPFRRRRSLPQLIREAERAVKMEETQLWMHEKGEQAV